MTWKYYGPNAVLIEFADGVGDEAFHRGRAIAKYLETHPPAGLIEFVSGFTTVLLEFAADAAFNLQNTVESMIGELDAAAKAELPAGPVTEIPVTYNGPDLERVATANGLSVPEVIQLHSEPVYKVYMLGFAPGFPYLGDLNPRLHTPRLSAPRLKVGAGSVAIGGEHTGIYSVESPGGWNIIGHTPLKIFDPDCDGTAMFALKPGDRVKFIAV